MRFTLLTKHFQPPTPLELATQELVEAERAKLVAETGLDYAKSAVAYNTARIARLKAYINSETKGAKRAEASVIS